MKDIYVACSVGNPWKIAIILLSSSLRVVLQPRELGFFVHYFEQKQKINKPPR